jgi:hypothetical protein
MSRFTGLLAALAITTAAIPAFAEPLHIEAVMSPKEQMQLNFKDGSNHLVLLVRREGKAEGQGVLAGSSVVEYGMHDIIPGVGGSPTGYLELTAANGDIAYINWHIGAVFVPGPDGKPVLLDNGYWQIVSGTGSLKDLVGAGTLHLKAVSPTDRRFILDGEVARKH